MISSKRFRGVSLLLSCLYNQLPHAHDVVGWKLPLLAGEGREVCLPGTNKAQSLDLLKPPTESPLEVWNLPAFPLKTGTMY